MKTIANTMYHLSTSALLFLSAAGSTQAAAVPGAVDLPEPSMLALLGLGVVSALVIAKRRK
jgi:hypothetical protein